MDEAADLSAENLFHLRITSAETRDPWMEISVPFLKAPVYPVFSSSAPVRFVFEARHLPSRQMVWVDKLDLTSFAGKQNVK